MEELILKGPLPILTPTSPEERSEKRRPRIMTTYMCELTKPLQPSVKTAAICHHLCPAPGTSQGELPSAMLQPARTTLPWHTEGPSRSPRPLPMLLRMPPGLSGDLVPPVKP